MGNTSKFTYIMSMIFFFSKVIRFVACLTKVQNFFIQSSPKYKVCLFSVLSKAHIFDTEYPQEYAL